MNANHPNYLNFPQIKNLEFSPQDDHHIVICDVERRQYFRVGQKEAALIQSLDGTCGIEQLGHVHRNIFHPDQVTRLVNWLADNELLVGSERPEGRLPIKTRMMKWLLRGRNPFRLTLLNPDAFLRKFPIEKLFSAYAQAAYWLMALLPVIFLLIDPAVIKRMSDAIAHFPGIAHSLLLILIILFTTVIHELAHAIACIHFGGRVNKIGIMIMYLMPTFYCDVSASWSFQSKTQRIIVASAGLIAHAAQGGILFLLWHQTDVPILLFASGICYALIMLNLLPFIKLDGYWMLAHFLGEPNLRARSLSRLIGTVFRRRVPRHADHAMLVTFGAILACGSLGFFMMGLFSIHNLLGYLSQILADWTAVALCIIATFRVMSYLFHELKEEKA